MKFTTAISMLAAFPVIYAFNVYVRSSDDLIDVGDLDLFSHTWKAIYSAAGNKEAVTIGPPAIAT
jgi:biopolymer transport protein ExbB/TolQ